MARLRRSVKFGKMGFIGRQRVKKSSKFIVSVSKYSPPKVFDTVAYALRHGFYINRIQAREDEGNKVVIELLNEKDIPQKLTFKEALEQIKEYDDVYRETLERAEAIVRADQEWLKEHAPEKLKEIDDE